MLDLKNFDWRSLKKYMEPQASKDLNVFLEHLPQNAGQTILIAAGIAWAGAAALGLFTMVKVQSLTELRTELKEAKALTPVVPKIKNVPVNKAAIEGFVSKTEPQYPGLSIRANGASIVITADSTANFGEFREALGHIQNGGTGWSITLEKLCVGRECDQRHKLAASVKISKVSVEKPQS